ncbi:MAG: hypothetical protein H7Y04_06265 [Verrucomicrobia bacterium]|nr:hypothetical protein [Cytophagales bacterium]
MYDTYGSIVYGIALEMSQNQKEAEGILISTFEKIYKQKLMQQDSHCICATLIKLTVMTACEQLKQTHGFKLKRFENTPLLHKLLCEQVSLASYCEENKLTQIQVAKTIREELNYLRNSHTKTNIKTQGVPQAESR